MRKLSAICFAIMAVVAGVVPSHADTISVVNIDDTPTHFRAAVNALEGVGAFDQTHTVNHVSTNWQSNSTIIEDSGFTADSVTVTWGIRHWIGPHADDISPNPILSTLSVTFTDPGTSSSTVVRDTRIVEHFLATGGSHFDIFTLSLFSIKDSATVNRDISQYTVIYDAIHSTVPVPEPASLALFGFASLLAWRRSASTPII